MIGNDYQLTFDATQDKHLQSQEGLVRRLSETLQDLLESGTDVPSHVTIELIYPDARSVDELQHSLQRLNKIIHPRGFVDRIAHTAFRSMSGVEGDLKPIEVCRGDDPSYMYLGLDLSGISREDLAHFARFLSVNAHRLS